MPFPAGGGTDIFARVVAERVAKVLGQPVVIENKGGAEGNIGMDSVAKAPADGYTILFNSSAATVNPAMYKSLPSIRSGTCNPWPCSASTRISSS